MNKFNIGVKWGDAPPQIIYNGKTILNLEDIFSQISSNDLGKIDKRNLELIYSLKFQKEIFGDIQRKNENAVYSTHRLLFETLLENIWDFCWNNQYNKENKSEINAKLNEYLSELEKQYQQKDVKISKRLQSTNSMQHKPFDPFNPLNLPGIDTQSMQIYKDKDYLPIKVLEKYLIIEEQTDNYLKKNPGVVVYYDISIPESLPLDKQYIPGNDIVKWNKGVFDVFVNDNIYLAQDYKELFKLWINVKSLDYNLWPYLTALSKINIFKEYNVNIFNLYAINLPYVNGAIGQVVDVEPNNFKIIYRLNENPKTGFYWETSCKDNEVPNKNKTKWNLIYNNEVNLLTAVVPDDVIMVNARGLEWILPKQYGSNIDNILSELRRKDTLTFKETFELFKQLNKNEVNNIIKYNLLKYLIKDQKEYETFKDYLQDLNNPIYKDKSLDESLKIVVDSIFKEISEFKNYTINRIFNYDTKDIDNIDRIYLTYSLVFISKIIHRQIEQYSHKENIEKYLIDKLEGTVKDKIVSTSWS